MPWEKEWLVVEAGGQRSIPAMEFLGSIPTGPRSQLLAIVDAVGTMGPDRWQDRQSHTAMKGDLAHLHEARDRHDQTLYRLFLRWLRAENTVVIIDGRWKGNATVIDEAEYRALNALSSTIDQDPPPYATVDDVIRFALDRES